MNKVLFISHDASRTGAPILLLNLLKWLKTHADFGFDILLLRDGELKQEFAKYGDVFVWYPKPKLIGLKRQIFNKLLNKNPNIEYRSNLLSKLKQNNYFVVYCNTVLTLEVAVEIKKKYNRNLPIINDIHEFPAIIENKLPNFKELSNHADAIIASSDLHKQILTGEYTVPESKITVIPDFTDTELKPSIQKKNTFTVGTMGTVHWRKGDDIFLQIARIINERNNSKIKFIWVGHMSNDKEVIIKNDIKKLNLNQTVEFKQASVDYRKYYNEIDLFVLLSREDPFPLVAIEAGMKGLPIICFENASGISEIIDKSKGGFVVDYLNTEKVAEKIEYYFKNRNKLTEDGNKNINVFRELTVDKVAPRIKNLLLKFSK